MKIMSIIAAAVFSGSLFAAQVGDYLIKVEPGVSAGTETLKSQLPAGSEVENLGIEGWHHVKVPVHAASSYSLQNVQRLPFVLKATPNYTIKLLENPTLSQPGLRERLARQIAQIGPRGGMNEVPKPDNPAIPMNGSGGSGPDPLFSKQWGMNQMGVQSAWSYTKGIPEIVVAVIDTGVDYTHEDLVDNLWRNPREIPGNGIDDDHNGYIDDVIGWDFADNDNMPFDLTASWTDMLFSGGNPGHGTHCAGNVAARGDNGKGIAGVAPKVRIMPLRFITVKGQGTTADAVKALRYAVDNGAKVTSNSWGSEGDDPNDPDTGALKDAIAYAENHGVLVIAAAGNGHQGVGYDNDTDAKPGVPASYSNDIIISVAAIDEAGALGKFSNWGARTVDLAAPGVKVFSTVTSSDKYTDLVIDIPGVITAYWDGTSMATPHVAGAAALYWSANPTKNWREVKNAILTSVKPNGALAGKMVSGGQLDVQNLMRH